MKKKEILTTMQTVLSFIRIILDVFVIYILKSWKEELDIELKDHVIVGGDKGKYFSFQEEGIRWNDFREDHKKEMRERYEVER